MYLYDSLNPTLARKAGVYIKQTFCKPPGLKSHGKVAGGRLMIQQTVP